MSRWLDIARAAKQQSGPSCHVPLVPIVPLGPVRGAFGTNDTNGTWHREAKAAALDLTDRAYPVNADTYYLYGAPAYCPTRHTTCSGCLP